MLTNALYKLQPITDNPRYEGFGFVRSESLRGTRSLIRDFDSDDLKTKGRAWSVPRLAAVWKRQEVAGRVYPFNDYPCVSLTIPAFSQRAVDALRDFLEPNGELLPLSSRIGTYYAYNVTTVADILDPEKSKIYWATEKRISASRIDRYECYPERMNGLSIFRIVETPSATFVNQCFVDRAVQHNLEGFHFIKVWPIEADESFQHIELTGDHPRRAQQQIGAVVKAMENTVVLLFSLSRPKPSKAEQQRLNEIMDEIDALLYVPTTQSNEPFFGRLEGDDALRGEIRLFLSCPNADALVDKLRPWLKTLKWKNGVRVLKRYGSYADPNCREEYVDV